MRTKPLEVFERPFYYWKVDLRVVVFFQTICKLAKNLNLLSTSILSQLFPIIASGKSVIRGLRQRFRKCML
ncbi:MAG: hypothetical protein ACREBS_07055 [Nitrososphaerales archaeon]